MDSSRLLDLDDGCVRGVATTKSSTWSMCVYRLPGMISRFSSSSSSSSASSSTGDSISLASSSCCRAVVVAEFGRPAFSSFSSSGIGGTADSSSRCLWSVRLVLRNSRCVISCDTSVALFLLRVRLRELAPVDDDDSGTFSKGDSREGSCGRKSGGEDGSGAIEEDWTLGCEGRRACKARVTLSTAKGISCDSSSKYIESRCGEEGEDTGGDERGVRW